MHATTLTVHDGVIRLEADGTALVLDIGGSGLPSVLHWGAALGELDDAAVATLRATAVPPVPSGSLDEPEPVSLVPEQSVGWFGVPGIVGSRHGASFATTFELVDSETSLDDTARVGVRARDVRNGLGLDIIVIADRYGVLRSRATLHNEGDDPFQLDALRIMLPLPPEADEVLDFTGRHLRERSPQRHPLVAGTHVRTSRRGRTGADATMLMIAGERGFDFEHGQVWAVHVAWSGNHETLVDSDPSGVRLLGGGEWLMPGEIRLAPGESYSTPWMYFAWGEGIDQLSQRLHSHVRARPEHPSGTRKVTLNSWEAVYFEHSEERIEQLARYAADVGVERFVLDDGWFRGRRDDTAGLGDWYVDETVWPRGLRPLADTVRGLGMEFGLWVEPEMVNPDSDLARRHPDWILAAGARWPKTARHQQVLDLTAPGVCEYLLRRLDSLVREIGVDYLKWDHNRDLLTAGHPETGVPAVHRQTHALYELVDRLRKLHPALEIESCASGGARVDLEILTRTERVWTSDCLDALERLAIQRWTGLLLPPELMGTHVGSPVAHTTGRTHTLPFRATTAMFGHFGIEWDISSSTADERAALAKWVALYKEFRGLITTGVVVRRTLDHGTLWLQGAVAADRSEALFCLARLATSPVAPYGRIRLPGLDEGATYRLHRLDSPGEMSSPLARPAPWESTEVAMSGRALAASGMQVPLLLPESACLWHLERTA